MKLLKLLFLCLTILSMSIISGCGSDSNSPAKPAPQKQEFTGSWIGMNEHNNEIKTLKIEKLGDQYIATANKYTIYHPILFDNETDIFDVKLSQAKIIRQKQAIIKNNNLDVPDTKGFFVLENNQVKGKATSSDTITTYIPLTEDNKQEFLNQLKEEHIREVKQVGKNVNRLNFKTLTKDQIKE